jgi:hypothetical protein
MAVELSDYMRRVLKWSWLIAVVTVAGGVIALLLTSQSATTYVTSATVAPPAEVGSAAQAQQYVSDFQAAAGSRAVQEAVTTDTEVARSVIADRVTVNRVGDSGLVSVSYRTPTRDDPKAEQIVQSVIDNTLALMYESRVAAAERGVAAAEQTVVVAQEGVAAAQARVDEFLAARGYVAPTDALASIQSQITDFEVREVEARARGDIAAANTFAARLNDLRQRQSDLGKDALAYRLLLEDVDSAKQQVVRAQEARENKAAAAAELRPEGNYTFGRKNEAQDRAAAIWRRTLAVMLACFVLSILLVAWLASLTPEHPVEAAADDDIGIDAGPAEAVVEPMDLDEEDVAPRPGRRSRYRGPKHDPDGITIGAQPS